MGGVLAKNGLPNLSSSYDLACLEQILGAL
jgi:hypothetical protein